MTVAAADSSRLRCYLCVCLSVSKSVKIYNAGLMSILLEGVKPKEKKEESCRRKKPPKNMKKVGHVIMSIFGLCCWAINYWPYSGKQQMSLFRDILLYYVITLCKWPV